MDAVAAVDAMDGHDLALRGFDLAPYRFGLPQRSGAMTVVPVFGPDQDGRFAGPLSGLKLSRVRGYGNLELSNPGEKGVAIVPLHMGYIQDRAQNHALCRSGFIAPAGKVMFEDACCVQAAQGGYLEGREQWFFILPLQLRDEALALRGLKGYSKLWPAIERLNGQFGLPSRGHLEQIISRERPVLTQYQSRFERLAGQTGALFFLGARLAGLEIAPSAAYFAEVWMALVCFCYGVAALQWERQATLSVPERAPLGGRTLGELRAALERSRRDVEDEVRGWLAATPPERFEPREEERFLGLRLHTVSGANFAGQYVEEAGRLVYASLFARPAWLGSPTGR